MVKSTSKRILTLPSQRMEAKKPQLNRDVFIVVKSDEHESFSFFANENSLGSGSVQFSIQEPESKKEKEGKMRKKKLKQADKSLVEVINSQEFSLQS